jgi:hypothetical protein
MRWKDKTTVTPADSTIFPLTTDPLGTDVDENTTWALIKSTIIAAFGSLISGLTGKTTPVDADCLALMDSAASNATKKLTWADVKGTLFDTDTTLAGNSDAKVATQKAVKTYVDNLAAGLKWKAPVKVATTTNATFSAAYANGQTVDGYVLVTGDRILIKDQSSQASNGIYTVNASGSPTRATDADSSAELVSAAVFVEQGTVNADKAFVCTNNATITIGSTSIIWTAFASVVGALLASNNLSDVGSVATARANLGTVPGNINFGYLNVPPNPQSANYTASLGDSGCSLDHPSTDANARTFTIPANASVAYPVGTCISFSNMTSQVLSIAITTDTMYLAGTGTTGTRSLAQYGTATARKLTSTTWIISGIGLT